MDHRNALTCGAKPHCTSWSALGRGAAYETSRQVLIAMDTKVGHECDEMAQLVVSAGCFLNGFGVKT